MIWRTERLPKLVRTMAGVDLSALGHFTAKRRAIRAALTEDGIAAEIEALVDALLPP